MTVSPHDIAHVLSEALPHMQRYDEEIVVVKYGGHAMGEEDMAQELRPRHRADGADRHQSGGRAWRRAADRRHAQAARHQVGIRGRAAHHRRRHHRDRRDGAGRLDQQADRRLHQRGRRQGGRPVRQGRQHGQGAQDQPHASPIPAPISRRWSISASSASRRRSTPPCSTRSSAATSSRCWRRSRPRRTAPPTTSTPTPSPAPSPARSRPSGCCC